MYHETTATNKFFNCPFIKYKCCFIKKLFFFRKNNSIIVKIIYYYNKINKELFY